MATFLSLLGRKDIVTSHEARVAQTARIMAISGWPWSATPVSVPVMRMTEIDGIKQLRADPSRGQMPVNPWLTPVINNQIRLQKPPLPYWCAAVIFRFAGVGEWQARLVPALLGLIATWLMWDVARMLLGRRAGLIAAGVWLSTHFIVDEYRKAMADPYLAFFTLMAIWAWMKAAGMARARRIPLDPARGGLSDDIDGRQTRTPEQDRRAGERFAPGSPPRGQDPFPGNAQAAYRTGTDCFHARFPSDFRAEETTSVIGIKSPRRAETYSSSSLFLIAFYIALAMGAMAKGPVILVTVLIAVLALRCLRVGPWWGHLAGVALFVVIVLPWPVYIMQHVPNAMQIWRYESVGEVTGENVEKARPWWMYIGNSFQLPLPWTPLWMGGFVIACVHGRRGIRGPRGRKRSGAILWQVLTIIFFSLSGVKKPAYLLPAMPAQTLIITDAILVMLAFARRRIDKARHVPMPNIIALAQALVGAGFAAGLCVVSLHSSMGRSTTIVFGTIVILASLPPFVAIVRNRFIRWFTWQVAGYAIVLVALLGLQRPQVENQRSSRGFADAMANYVQSSQLPVVVHALPEDLALYLPLNVPDVGNGSYALLAVDHSPKDSLETLESLSKLLDDGKVIEARRVDLKSSDGNGRWRLFEVTILHPSLRI